MLTALHNAQFGIISEDSQLLSVSAGSNELSLVLRDRGVLKFVKYVSANAPGSRCSIQGKP